MTQITMMSPSDLTIDPVAEFLPRVSEHELAQLSASIAAQGILQPIMLRRGTNAVIDGRHRLEVARNLGLVNVPCIAAEESDFETALSVNMLRRHLTTSQRAALAVALFDQTPGANVNARMRIAAARMNVSWSYAMTALRLRNRAGLAALARVRSGELSLQAAMRDTGAAYARRSATSINDDEPANAPASVQIAQSPAAPAAGLTEEQAAALPGVIAEAYAAFLASGSPAATAARFSGAALNATELFAFADFLIAIGDIAATRAAA